MSDPLTGDDPAVYNIGDATLDDDGLIPAPATDEEFDRAFAEVTITPQKASVSDATPASTSASGASSNDKPVSSTTTAPSSADANPFGDDDLLGAPMAQSTASIGSADSGSLPAGTQPPSFGQDTKAPAQARTRAFEITVTHPEKHGDGMNAFVSYQVNTRTTLPQFDVPEFSVRRRFRDFEWLRSTMKSQHLGCVIPPLPEKFLVGRFTTGFIEQRRRALFKFLNRISVHPLLHKTEEFQVFLQASDDALERYKAQKETRPEIVEGVFSMFKSIKRSVQSSVGNATGQVSLAVDLPDDFETTKSYALDLETQLTTLRKSVEKLTKKRAEFAAAEQEFGLALTLMGCCESPVANLGNSLTQMGRTVESLSKLDTKQSDKEVAYFEDPVKEYIGLTQALQEMLRNCDDARMTLAEAQGSLQSKQNKLEQYRQTPGKEERCASLVQEIEQAELTVGDARRDYAAIRSNIQDEVERFHQDKIHDFRKLLHNFLNLQINHHYKVLYGWQSLIATVETIHGDPAGTIPDEQD